MITQQTKKIASGTWCIDEFSLVNAFVAEGKELSALIDTGCGYGNIRAVAESLTDKPLIVLMTHAHPDHIGGAYHFPDVKIYMSDEDKPLLNIKVPGFSFDNEFRKMYVKTRGPVRCPGKEEEILKTIPQNNPGCSFNSINITDGMIIDLGERELECIHTPGHSEGSMCFLNKNSRILFSGDTVNNSIILMRQPDNNPSLIEKYRKTLEKLWLREKEFDYLAIGHDGDIIDKDIIHDYLILCSGILNGTIEGKYEETGFRKGDVARYGKAELWFHCDA